MAVNTKSMKAFLAALVCLSLALRASAADSRPDVVLVGATGNLAKKYLWQILFDLHRAGKVGRVFAGATKPKEKGTGLINGIVNDHIKCSDDACEQARGQFRDTVVEYMQLRQNEQYGDLATALDKTGSPNRLFFLSVSPDFYPQIAKNINMYARPKAAGGGWLRVIFEKPFGRDAASAKALADVLRAELAEEEVYRIDHYLGKEAVQAVGGFRRANADVLEPMWGRDFIESVSIVMKEKETCEGRTGFYDRYGVIRDVLQNHLLELVAFVAAELPAASSPGAPIDRLSLLKQVREATVEETILGQYKGYAAHVLEDSGGKTNSTTVPTAATVRLFIDSDRWRDVPFILSAGKGLDERAAYVRVRFRPGKYARDEDEDGPCDVLMHLQGGNLGTATTVCKHLPAPMAASGWEFEGDSEGGIMFKPERKAPNPYFVLISGAIDGRRDLFCGTEELHQLWRVWTPLLAAIDKGAITPTVLPVGQEWSAAEKMMGATVPVECKLTPITFAKAQSACGPPCPSKNDRNPFPGEQCWDGQQCLPIIGNHRTQLACEQDYHCWDASRHLCHPSATTTSSGDRQEL